MATAEVVGQTLRIDGRSFAIIGVMPPVGFNGQGVGGQLGWRSIWTPFRANEAKAQNNPGRLVRVTARLKARRDARSRRAPNWKR